MLPVVSRLWPYVKLLTADCKLEQGDEGCFIVSAAGFGCQCQWMRLALYLGLLPSSLAVQYIACARLSNNRRNSLT